VAAVQDPSAPVADARPAVAASGEKPAPAAAPAPAATPASAAERVPVGVLRLIFGAIAAIVAIYFILAALRKN
jgi:hypothetical protein